MSGTETIEKEDVGIEVPDTAAPAAQSAPAREDLQEAGWSPEEIERAEKRGLIGKGEAPAAAAKAEPAGGEPKAGKDTIVPAKKPEAEADPEKKAEPQARVSSLPDYKFTPEEQKLVDDNFGKGHPFRAFYFRAKNERQARQKAEARAAALEAQLAGRGAAPAAEPEAGTDEELDRPLTPRMLQEIEKRREDERKRVDLERRGRQQVLAEAHGTQEEYAKSAYEDFDTTVVLAKDVMQNLESLFPDKVSQQRVEALMQELQVAAYNADKLSLDDRHAAHIAYEIGRLHPKYGKAASAAEPKDGPSKEIPKASGGFKPETLKRIETNALRKASSASVPAGGGKRTVLAEDMTESDLASLDYKARAAFRAKHPEHYARLMRG